MALAIGNRAGTTSLSATITISSFTVTAVSPLFVEISWHAGESITLDSVTWNTSESLAEIGTTQTEAPNARMAVFAIKNPTATTANLVVTFSGAPTNGASVDVIGTTGGDTSTGWRTVFTRTLSDGAGPGLTVTDSQNGDIVFHAARVNETTITFDGGEDTTSTEHDLIETNPHSAGLSTKSATGANTVVGCTDTANPYVEKAFAVIPGAAGGAIATPSPTRFVRGQRPSKKRRAA